MPTPKQILIVDDEVGVLKVLKAGLKQFADDYRVMTATNGRQALALLQETRFALIVTDYQMGGLNGLELLREVRRLQPEARVIMITAYGTAEIEQKARRLQAYEYLTKPLEIEEFRQTVQDALADVAVSNPDMLILSENRFEQAVAHLDALRIEIGAHRVFLADATGRIIAEAGEEAGKMDMTEIVPLLGGSVATLLEVGRALDGDLDALNLVYREGAQENLYMVTIGRQILMVALVEQGTYSTRLGSVWYYARRTAEQLRETVGELADNTPPPWLMEQSEDMTASFDDELSKLFGDEAAARPHKPTIDLDDAVETGLLPGELLGEID